jgi:hypothetical protein
VTARPVASRWSRALVAFRRGGRSVLRTRLLARCLLPIGTWQELVVFEKELADDVPAITAAVPLEMHVVSADGAQPAALRPAPPRAILPASSPSPREDP